MNTAEFLSISHAICPDKTAIIFEGKRFTYSQLNERCNRLANALSSMGVKKGDRVAIMQVNCNQYVETYFATARLGAIFVPLNFRAKEDEISYMLQNAEAHVMLVGDRYLDLVEKIKSAVKVSKYISLDKPAKGFLFYEEVLSFSSPEDILKDVEESDVTILMYTAGTTGRPKGVPLTHQSFVSYVLGNVEPADPDTKEVNLLSVPLYHIAGCQAMIAAIYGGRTIAMMRQFEVNEWIQIVQREKANRAMLVPTMLKRVIDHPDFDKFDLSSLKVITYGAASMPFEVIKKAIRVMPHARFINAFGQTETASTITALGPEDHILDGSPKDVEKKLRRLSSSIGKPLPDVEMKVMDEQGKEVPVGETGEIVAKGPRVMQGYWKDAEKTAKAFTKDGWLKTSDMGWRDEENYFYLAGRGDDMIIRGGENISPEEVENAIGSYPAVEEVAVIGVPDDEWGQQPRAIVVLKPGSKATAEEIMEHCRTRLSSFKKPQSVVFVDTLPRNPMGKILKRVLRQEYGK